MMSFGLLQRSAQLPQQSAQSHFRLSSLKAVFHRGLGALLGLGSAGALAEEIGIAAEVLGRRERDRVDALLESSRRA